MALTALIENLSHEGRGVTHINGKTVFIDHALTGETVEFAYKQRKRSRRRPHVISNENASHIVLRHPVHIMIFAAVVRCSM